MRLQRNRLTDSIHGLRPALLRPPSAPSGHLPHSASAFRQNRGGFFIEIYFFFAGKTTINRLQFLKQTFILLFGAFVWVCGCKSRPVAGETIHVSGQSPVSMVRLRSKTNRVTERGSSGEPCGLRSEPSCWRVWGQRPGQPYNRHQQNTKRGKYNVRRQGFDLQGLRP